jgi:hypothetical protein
MAVALRASNFRRLFGWGLSGVWAAVETAVLDLAEAILRQLPERALTSPLAKVRVSVEDWLSRSDAERPRWLAIELDQAVKGPLGVHDPSRQVKRMVRAARVPVAYSRHSNVHALQS